MASQSLCAVSVRPTAKAQTCFGRTGPCRKLRSPIAALKSSFIGCNKAQNAKIEGHANQAGLLCSHLLAAGASAALLLCPLTALAVAGGGGTPDGLAYQDLSNTDLRKLKLVKTNLRKANFNNSNMSGVSMFACLAKDASFVGTNLTGADLESGYFEDVDFTNAVLEGAYVNNAQFINVKIENTDWTDVIVRKDVQKQLCSVAKGSNPQTGVDTRESLGCY